MRLMGEAGIKVNLVFMFLNLLPILPLDGGRILASLLPNRVAWQYSRLEPWGLPLLVLLLLTNVLDIVLMPLIGTSDALIRALGPRRFDLVGAPADGLALGRLVLRGGREISLLTKAGGFRSTVFDALLGGTS